MARKCDLLDVASDASLRALRPCRYHRSRKDSAEHEEGDEARGTEQREDDPHEGACPKKNSCKRRVRERRPG